MNCQKLKEDLDGFELKVFVFDKIYVSGKAR